MTNLHLQIHDLEKNASGTVAEVTAYVVSFGCFRTPFATAVATAGKEHFSLRQGLPQAGSCQGICHTPWWTVPPAGLFSVRAGDADTRIAPPVPVRTVAVLPIAVAVRRPVIIPARPVMRRTVMRWTVAGGRCRTIVGRRHDDHRWRHGLIVSTARGRQITGTHEAPVAGIEHLTPAAAGSCLDHSAAGNDQQRGIARAGPGAHVQVSRCLRCPGIGSASAKQPKGKGDRKSNLTHPRNLSNRQWPTHLILHHAISAKHGKTGSKMASSVSHEHD